MKLSRDWLNDYVDVLSVSAEDFVDMVTTKIAEVEGVEILGESLNSARIVRVESVSPHPSRSELTVCSINVDGTSTQVVCGAPNAVAGMCTAYLPPGASFWKSGERVLVEAREVAGVASHGILVSERELGVSEDHSGIVELEPGAFGSSISEHLGSPDLVIEIDNKSLTHRPDLWCHFGFARELSAILGRPLKRNLDDLSDATSAGQGTLTQLAGEAKGKTISVKILDDRCRRFMALGIGNLSVERSPFWLRRRLWSVGSSPKNLLVDLSNYVMLDVGQPNHIYDARSVPATGFVVRRGHADEKFVALDDVERELDSEDIVIGGESAALGLGGVIGGRDDSVRPDTTEVVIESANFDPVAIRLSARKHVARTDASNRFEKSLSPHLPPVGLLRLVELLSKHFPHLTLTSELTDAKAFTESEIVFPFDAEYIRNRLGVQLSDKDIHSILKPLGFVFSEEPGSGGGPVTVRVPYYRATRDVSLMDDLVEEVGRIYGYERIPESPPVIPSTVTPRDPRRDLQYKLQDALRAAGFSEIFSQSFVEPTVMERFGYPQLNAIVLRNPVDQNESVMRTSLVPIMCRRIEENTRFDGEVSLFEFGRGFYSHAMPTGDRKVSGPASEHAMLALGVCGSSKEGEGSAALVPPLPSGATFYNLRGIVTRLIRIATGCSPKFEPLEQGGDPDADTPLGSVVRAWMHPHRHAKILLNDVVVGILAEASSDMLEDSSQRVVLAELCYEELLKQTKIPQMEEVTKFPASVFEMSVVMDLRREYRDLERFLRTKTEESVWRGIEVLSVYTGAPLPVEKKSVSVKLWLGRSDRTLARDELSAIQNGLIDAVQSSGEYSLRLS